VVRLLIAAGLLLVVVAVALVLQRRRPDPPTQPRTYPVPRQLDRNDFDRPEAPWLVAVFTSSTCLSCEGTWDRARHLESTVVAVQEIEVGADRGLHDRYGVEAVPLLLVGDAEGVVRASFVGPPTAADLWATVAELREPGSTPVGCDHHGSAPAD
jgi:hypothetical protein